MAIIKKYCVTIILITTSCPVFVYPVARTSPRKYSVEGNAVQLAKKLAEIADLDHKIRLTDEKTRKKQDLR